MVQFNLDKFLDIQNATCNFFIININIIQVWYKI